MVWFQCEDCGENLKKPKLPNHFHRCSASTWSCIDCNQVFNQQSVQSHTQCISETEKYGPKGAAKTPDGTNSTPKTEAKQKPEVDINVGLSDRPPWFCSLCNTKATSKQALLLHADGKKHRAKARAFHSKNQPLKEENESSQNTDILKENNKSDELPTNAKIEGKEVQIPCEVACVNKTSEVVNGNPPSDKKRKLVVSENDGKGESGNGEVIQIEKGGNGKKKVKKAKCSASEENDVVVVEPSAQKDDAIKKIKWKKLIISSLQSNPEGVLKMRKLKKLVTEALRKSCSTEDESRITNLLEQKINSSSKFMVEGKYVRLMAKQ